MVRLLLLAVLVACSGSPGGPTMSNRMSGPDPVAQSSDVVSAEVLSREPVANTSQVKHILIGWSDSDSKDARAQARSKADAEAQVRSVLGQIKAGTDFDALMKQHSEDPGSAQTGRPYTVTPDAGLVIEFKQLGLRLNVGEVGVVQSDIGFHIMKRVE